MKVISLASGSKGNSTLILTSKHNLLIDVGISVKQLNLKLMMSEGLDLNDISLILLSHAHIDHIQSFHTIYKQYPHIKFIMSSDTYTFLNEKYPTITKDNIFIISEVSKGETLDITPLHLTHDSPCYGYMIHCIETNDTLVFIADNGGLWDKDIISLISNKEYYCIESNYDEMSQYFDTTRNAILKRRVLSHKGHNSNIQAIELATKIIGERTRSLQFTHLSVHTNTEDLACRTHLAFLEVWGKLEEWKEILISYGNQDNIVPLDSGTTHKEIRGVR